MMAKPHSDQKWSQISWGCSSSFRAHVLIDDLLFQRNSYQMMGVTPVLISQHRSSSIVKGPCGPTSKHMFKTFTNGMSKWCQPVPLSAKLKMLHVVDKEPRPFPDGSNTLGVQHRLPWPVSDGTFRPESGQCLCPMRSSIFHSFKCNFTDDHNTRWSCAATGFNVKGSQWRSSFPNWQESWSPHSPSRKCNMGFKWIHDQVVPEK